MTQRKTLVQIGNGFMPLNRLLNPTDANLLAHTLSLSQRLSLALTKITYIGTMQSKGFAAPTKIYAVREKHGVFLSYRQGYSEVFYDITDEKNV
jgi:hypothetical protein